MSYYATGKLEIAIKEKKDIETVMAIVEKEFSEDIGMANERQLFGYLDDFRYYEDEHGEQLDKLIPFIESGCEELVGEDGLHLRYIFKDGEWEKQEGVVVYCREDAENYLKNH